MKLKDHLKIINCIILSPRLLYLDDWLYGPLLDGGWFLKAIGVDSAEQILTQVHVVKCRNNLQKYIDISKRLDTGVSHENKTHVSRQNC